MCIVGLCVERAYTMIMQGFPVPDDPDARVWRYLDLAKFVWLLEKKQLWFTRADKLGDSFEMTLPAGTVNELALLHQSLIEAGTIPAGRPEEVAELRSRLRKRLFVSSWHLSEFESQAMWRLFCGPSQGLVIQTRFRTLTASLPVTIGRVTYLDYNKDSFPELLPDLVHMAPVMFKRQAFAYEQELRAVLHYEWEEDRGRHVDGVGLEWDPSRHVENIYTHPDAPYFFTETVEAVVKALAPGLSRRVFYSQLARAPHP